MALLCRRSVSMLGLTCIVLAAPVLADDDDLDGEAALEAVIDGPAPPEAPDVVSRDEQGRATIRAVRLIEDTIDVDGRLEENLYRRVPSISGFLQQEPHEGQPATEETEVWVFFDDANVYVSARCWDSQPDRIVANEMRRDNRNIINNANFAVILDTFYDRRDGVLFHTNPLGALYDGQVTGERRINSDWNTVWSVKTARFSDGWTVEMAIPFKSLRHKQGQSQIWGINFRRIVRWKNEWSYLTPMPASFNRQGIIKLSQAATLVGVEPPAKSTNLEVKPYAIGGAVTDLSLEAPIENDLDGNVGFDLKYGVTKSLVADFTVNTDFAQVEDDEQQVNLTRFSLFFPEKREFFLEGQGNFAFGGTNSGRRFGGPQDVPILFFSRRIGLDDGIAVPIQAGGRLTGRAGKYTLGLLNVQADSALNSDGDMLPTTNFSVVRLKRDVLRRSNIGMIATNRSASTTGVGSNSVFGMDAAFTFYQNLNITGFYAKSRTEGLRTDDDSYQGRVSWNGDRYGASASYLKVGDNFNPEIGFVRRRDVRKSRGRFRFSPRPSGPSRVRKYNYEISIDNYQTGLGLLESRQLELQFRPQFNNGDNFRAEYTNNYEYLDEEFEISDGVVIPAGEYEFNRLQVGYRMGPQRRVSGWTNIEFGSFFGGKRMEISYWGRVEMTPQFSLEPNISQNWIDLPWGDFTTTLVRLRGTYTLSPRQFIGALVQYSTSNHSVTSNLRYRWEYRPGSDLFIVYSDGHDTLTRGYPGLVNRSLVFKFTRLFRF